MLQAWKGLQHQGLGHLPHQERLRSLRRVLLKHTNTWRESQALFTGARWQDQRQQEQTETQRFPLNIRKHFLMWGQPNTGAGCQECCGISLFPWRHSNAIWTWYQAACSRWPCLGRGLDQKISRGLCQPQHTSKTARSGVPLFNFCCYYFLFLHLIENKWPALLSFAVHISLLLKWAVEKALR